MGNKKKKEEGKILTEVTTRFQIIPIVYNNRDGND